MFIKDVQCSFCVMAKGSITDVQLIWPFNISLFSSVLNNPFLLLTKRRGKGAKSVQSTLKCTVFANHFGKFQFNHYWNSKVTCWTSAAVGKTLLSPRHTLNAFSDPRHSWTWELVEASKSWLPILLLVVYTNWNLAYTTRQGSRVSCLAQTGFAAFGKALQLIRWQVYRLAR